MATLEKRMQALEQEHTDLKKTIELHTMAIGALVNKTTLEKLNEKYDKLFEALIAHDSFASKQLAEVRNQHTELDGKLVGLQTEVRQRFTDIDGKVTGLQTEVRQRFTQLETTQEEQTTALGHLAQTQQEQTTALGEQKDLLKAILARLPQER